jgi:MFS family permease
LTLTTPQNGTGTVAQGVLLCLLATLNVAAALVIAPVLPSMVEAFASDPDAKTKVLLAQALPALVLAITALVAGRIADKTGRKRLLLVSLVVYLICGLAPFFLSSLNQILVSRIGVGLAESGFMTASTTLIGDYFKGPRRTHWLVMQTSTASVSAILLTLIGGVLGDMGWRYPFIIYALPVLFLPLVIVMIKEPTVESEDLAVKGFPWGQVLPFYGIAFIAALFFMIPPIQTPFLLTERGTTEPRIIGLISAAATIAVPIGSFAFKALSRLSIAWILGIAFGLIAAGLGLVVFDRALPFTIAGIVTGSFGCGIILPALLTTIMSRLSFVYRGLGTGGWQMAFFLGQSFSPLVVLFLSAKLAGLDGAMSTMAIAGGVCFAFSMLCALSGLGKPLLKAGNAKE